MERLKFDTTKKYLVYADQLWDGVSSSLEKDRVISISNGIIDSITEKTDSTPNHNENIIKLNIPDLTIMPGLVDCHVHLSFDSNDLKGTIEEWSTAPHLTWKRLKHSMLETLTKGIVIIRDGGDLYKFGLKARDKQLAGDLTGPQVIATGTAIHKKGKYGSFLGPGISSLKDAEEQIKSLIQQNIDQLKVIISGLVSFKDFGKVGNSQFTADELTPIVDLAHQYGLKVMAHASSDEAVAIGIKANVDSIEHGYFISTDSLKRMAEKGTSWVPTIAPLGNLLKESEPPYPGADLNVIKRSYEQQLVALDTAIDLNVKVGVGTDAGANKVYHGVSYFDELNYFLKAGVTPEKLINLATSVSAEIAGIKKTGFIKTGYKPFIIGIQGDPFKNINSLSNPYLVITPKEILTIPSQTQ